MQPSPSPAGDDTEAPPPDRGGPALGAVELVPPDVLTAGKGLLSPLERMQIRLVRGTLRPGLANGTIRFFQRTIGQWWIRAATRRLSHIHGLDRLPPWDPGESVVCVANHRSFFDLYVVTAELVALGLPYRILFPVRSAFFYDHPLGPIVNGAMSFFAMYPPIFREKKRAALNLAGLDELAALLRRGGLYVGIHPEGTRNKGSDPYSLLPTHSGVGRVIRKSRARVLPVFVNGLGNHLVRQIAGGLRGKGETIHVVFGAPVDMGDLLEAPESPRTYRLIAERCGEEIAKLGQEERVIRTG